MSVIDFEQFQGNSSSTEALIDFASGFLTFPALRKGVWYKPAKVEVAKMKKLGRKRSLRLARRWCTQNGYDYTCSCECGRDHHRK